MIQKVSDPNTEQSPVAHRPRTTSLRRHLFFAIPTAAAAAAAAFVLGTGQVESTTAEPSGPPPASDSAPAPAGKNALKLTNSGDYLEIRIVDPVADPDRYKAELAARGLDIDLVLAAASPDRVGRVVFMESETGTGAPEIETIEAPGKCSADGSCSVGVRVPADYNSYARIVFGRTPAPGESVEAGGRTG